jgi:hypothetical protein
MTLLVGVLSCAPGDFGAGAKMANTIANGVACGMAAANGTPCTPQAVLDALERDAAAQREKVSAVAPQAAAVDPALTEKLLAQLANRLSGALFVLRQKQHHLLAVEFVVGGGVGQVVVGRLDDVRHPAQLAQDIFKSNHIE